MPINVKEGVEFAWEGAMGEDGIDLSELPAGFRILEAMKKASRKFNRPLTITSGREGTHSGPTDPHKKGAAYDIRTNDLPAGLPEALVQALQSDLGSRFYVFWEAKGTPNAHIHAQRRKNSIYTINDYLNEL